MPHCLGALGGPGRPSASREGEGRMDGMGEGPALPLAGAAPDCLEPRAALRCCLKNHQKPQLRVPLRGPGHRAGDILPQLPSPGPLLLAAPLPDPNCLLPQGTARPLPVCSKRAGPPPTPEWAGPPLRTCDEFQGLAEMSGKETVHRPLCPVGTSPALCRGPWWGSPAPGHVLWSPRRGRGGAAGDSAQKEHGPAWFFSCANTLPFRKEPV